MWIPESSASRATERPACLRAARRRWVNANSCRLSQDAFPQADGVASLTWGVSSVRDPLRLGVMVCTGLGVAMKMEGDPLAFHVGPPERAEELVADGLLNVRQAAAFLGISRSKLNSLMERGELPYVKLGAARRIPKRALIALAARSLIAWEPLPSGCGRRPAPNTSLTPSASSRPSGACA